uniref:Ribosome biogenesis protein NOP53 n=1 Tax=Panagrellus redivivus TaxID=6233 RepID=A0A7E4V3D8_PANRE
MFSPKKSNKKRARKQARDVKRVPERAFLPKRKMPKYHRLIQNDLEAYYDEDYCVESEEEEEEKRPHMLLCDVMRVRHV